MSIASLGGNLLGIVPLGDIVFYLNPFHLFMFVTILIFTFLIAIGHTETQVEAEFGTLADKRKSVDIKEFKARRFLSVICGIATAGAMITGDLYNLTLFILTNIAKDNYFSVFPEEEKLNYTFISSEFIVPNEILNDNETFTILFKIKNNFTLTLKLDKEA